MIKLKSVTVHKYKPIESDQAFAVEKDVTVLVGMNESGKTSILEAIAKTNYFEADDDFKFNATHDYPRKEKKKMDKSGVDPAAITCSYELEPALVSEIDAELGKGTIAKAEFAINTSFANKRSWAAYEISSKALLGQVATAAGMAPGASQVAGIKSAQEFSAFLQDAAVVSKKDDVAPFAKYFENKWGWPDPIQEYVARTLITPRLPKFLYYDEYYSLPSRISIEKLQANQLHSEEMKTAKALLELADIKLEQLVKATDFEDYKAELEATQATITEELFKFWSTNTNLEIQFDIEKKEQNDPRNHRIVEHILDIRVRNTRTAVSLPLRNRSKGFNWFFSFLVWFKKIQEDAGSKYVILLDEPGLNLHASAQSDLLDFLEQLSAEYQVIYTTHSPFMVRPAKLHRVRTVLDTKHGSVVSDSIQEKDPKTLFPLQAALGYDIAQNLMIAPKNLLVEGTSDLVFLEAMSGILEAAGRKGLRDDVTIVPVGGLEKVATFISLLRGSKLEIVCLLDSIADQAAKSKMERLIADKIIKQQKILFYESFIGGSPKADVEDLFLVGDYLKLFNAAFQEHGDIEQDALGTDSERIVERIAKALGKQRYNHYRPANQLARQGITAADLNEVTLKRFEEAIAAVNAAY